RIATMLGFKGFATAAITIAGIELMHRIRKGQFGLGRLGVQGRLAPAVWMPCSKLEVSTVQHGTLSGAGYLHQSPYCVLSFEAVTALRAKGYHIRRLEDGYPEWSAAGLPVERTSSSSANAAGVQ